MQVSVTRAGTDSIPASIYSGLILHCLYSLLQALLTVLDLQSLYSCWL